MQPDSDGSMSLVSGLGRVRRFLCLGSLSTCYSVHDSLDLSVEKAECIRALIVYGRGEDVVSVVVAFNEEGRDARRDTSVLVLAMCARLGDDRTKQRAYDAFERVCRIPTHLFQFVELCENLNMTAGAGSGWGRAHRRAIR